MIVTADDLPLAGGPTNTTGCFPVESPAAPVPKYSTNSESRPANGSNGDGTKGDGAKNEEGAGGSLARGLDHIPHQRCCHEPHERGESYFQTGAIAAHHGA